MIQSIPNRKEVRGLMNRLMSLFDVLSEFVMSFLVLGCQARQFRLRAGEVFSTWAMNEHLLYVEMMWYLSTILCRDTMNIKILS